MRSQDDTRTTKHRSQLAGHQARRAKDITRTCARPRAANAVPHSGALQNWTFESIQAKQASIDCNTATFRRWSRV